MSTSLQRGLLSLLVLLLLLEHPSHASESRSLTPFVGETMQEFEARKRGLKFERADRRGGSLTVSPDARGHFFVEPTFGGRTVRMLVDTGASLVALSFEDAERASIRVSNNDFTHNVATANGIVAAAPVRINELQLGDISVSNVEAVVLPSGALDTSLLGMSFLRRLSAFEITNGQLALRQ